MTNNIMLGQQTQVKHAWVYKLLLFISFVWISIYPATSMVTSNFYFGFGGLFDSASRSSVVIMVLAEALSYWIVFEIIFFLYRWVLGFKIYSFIVPANKLKIETRAFFTYRNVFYGIFVNLCFLFPYLHSYALFFDLVITFIVLIAYANHLNKTYAEPIIGHFVFKCFSYPVFIYEALTIISSIVEVLSWGK